MLSSISSALEDLKLGKMIVVIDDEDRENEGDLIMAAEFADDKAINFMTKFGRGLICVPMEEELAYRAALKRARRLRNLAFKDFRKKLYSHLAQRGFSYDVVAPVIERVWEQERDTQPEEEEYP